MKKYLITSSCEYLSTALSHYLISIGHQVTHLLLPNNDNDSQPATDNNAIKLSCAELHLVKNYMEGVSGCFHVSMTTPVNQTMDISRSQYLQNIEQTTIIFNQAALMQIPLVFTSSASVYGNNVDFPLSEHSITNPTTLLGANMLAIEQYARVLSLSYDIPITALRLFDVYGGKAIHNRVTNNLLKQLKKKIFFQDKLVIKESLNSVYDFIHIDDAVRGFSCAMENITSPFQVINLCSGQSVTADQIVCSIMNITSESSDITLLHNGYKQQCLSVGDNKLGKKLLKFEPNINLIEGLTTLFRPLMPLS